MKAGWPWSQISMKAHIHVGVRPRGCLFLFSWPCILLPFYCSHSNLMSARYPASEGTPPLTTIWISYFFFSSILCTFYTRICFAIPNGPGAKLNHVFCFVFLRLNIFIFVSLLYLSLCHTNITALFLCAWNKLLLTPAWCLYDYSKRDVVCLNYSMSHGQQHFYFFY